MAVRHYVAIIEPAAEGYGVFFPDLPGCTSGGATLEEAALNAEEALWGHIEAAAEHGYTVPEPSSLDALEVAPDVNQAARLLVKVGGAGEAVRVNLTLPGDVLAAADNFAERRGLSRSGLVAQALREKMQRDRAA
jgi:predicted RNase H-like HicB family nuclease